MKRIIFGIAATAIAFAILSYVLPQVKMTGSIPQLLILSVVFGIANSFIKPIVKILSFPVNMMTMGVFGFAINVAMLLGVVWVADTFFKVGFTIGGFPKTGFTADTLVAAVIASIAFSIISAIVGKIVHD